MPTFLVKVTKMQSVDGEIRIVAKDADDAKEKVEAKIASGDLQTTFPAWNDPKYVDFSFETVGVELAGPEDAGVPLVK